MTSIAAFYYLYGRISVLVNMEIILFRSLSCSQGLGGLGRVGQWRHRRQGPLAVQVLLQKPASAHTHKIWDVNMNALSAQRMQHD